MPNVYAAQTALSSVGGRIGYVSSPAKQENLLAVYDGAADMAGGTYWRTLAHECEIASKHAMPGRKCVQGRELVVQLSNALLQRMTPEQIAKTLATEFEQRYGRPCFVAVHWNKTKTNLHAHIIYSERELLAAPEVKIAPRRLFFDENGTRRYKKAEVLDAAGELRPGCRIVEKGEEYERRCFGPVDPAFSRKGWLRDCKTNWVLPLRNGVLKGDVEITEYDASTGKLPQQHIGNKLPEVNPEKAAQIAAYNEAVKEYNSFIDKGIVEPDAAKLVQNHMKQASRKNNLIGNLVMKLREIMVSRMKKQRDEKPRPTVAAPAQPEPMPVPAIASLITADEAVERAEKVAARAAARIWNERPINNDLLALPRKLRAEVQQLRDECYNVEDIRIEMDKLQRPEQPGLFATKKKQAQYERAVAEYNARYEPLKAALGASRHAIAESLAAIMPELRPEERIKQGHGYNAPLVDATNITVADVYDIERAIEFKLRRAGEIGVAVANEERYAADIEALNAARADLGSAKEEFDSLMARVPLERVEAMQEAIKEARAERAAEAAAGRSAKAEQQRQPKRRSWSIEK